MFYLCSVESKDIPTIFGRFDPLNLTGRTPPKYPNLKTIMIGQKTEGSGILAGHLLLANEVVEEFQRHYSVPEGYEFVFRQEWGLTINEEIIHRVISTLRAESYPPMADYLDAVVKGDEAQKQKYLDDCLAVKAKYPKFSW